jgi:hypothetical protein
METETPIPSLTPTPSETPTPTATLTPTLAYYAETTLSEGQGARFERTVTAGDFTIVVLLAALLFTLWGMMLYQWLRSWKAERK